MGARILGLTLLCAACPATETFTFGDGGPGFDGGAFPDVGRGVDVGPADGAMGTECDPQPLCEGGCPRPWLLAANEDIFENTACHGRVLRYSIGADGSYCGCLGYAADDHVRAVGYLPGPGGGEGQVFAASGERIVGFGPPRIAIDVQTLLAFHDAADIFPLENDEGVLGALVVMTPPPSAAASGVWVGPDGTPRLYRFTAWGSTFAGSTNSWTSNPRSRRGIRLSRSSYPSMDVDPWNNMSTDLTHFASRSPGAINAFYFAGKHRTVLAVPGVDTDYQGVFSVAVATDEGGHMPPVSRCLDEMFATCSYDTAVGDPFSEDHVYTTCIRTAETESYLLRMNVVDQSCTIVREPVPETRICRLALALDDYWE